MSPQDGITTLTDAQLEAMLDRSAERGAREALKALGLEDREAPIDIHELRTLLMAWRDTRKAIWQTVIKAGVTLILAVLALGVWAWVRGHGTGGQ